MGDGFLDLILFAMIAAFLVFRLRSVLGRWTGNERPPSDPLSPRPADTPAKDNVVDLDDRPNPNDGDDRDETIAEQNSDDPLVAGVAQIRSADPNFTQDSFSEGAKSAFEMVVQSFAEGDLKTLRSLLNDEVYENFSIAVKQRQELGEELETTVISIKGSDLLEARLEGRMAFATLKFQSEQVNVTRDKDGEVVDGDPTQVTEVTDIWTFARNTRARDPNWTLVETRSSN
jgi:predicted lipid-binding transport protein (Tim44 family)